MCQLWSHVIPQLFQWFGIQYHRTACQFLWHDIISPNIPQPFWMQPGAKTSPSCSTLLLVSFVPLVSQAGAACTVYSCWEVYDMPTSVDGPENHLIPKPTALLVHILRRFSDGGLAAACSVLLQMISQPAAQELLKGFSYFLLGTSRLGYWYDISPKCPDLRCKSFPGLANSRIEKNVPYSPTMSKYANIFRQSLCTNCTSTGMCISIYIYIYIWTWIWIWICSQRPAASLLLSESANIGAHSDFSNDPKAKWSCKTAKTANMDLLVQHVMTHLAKCCQESFNYLNSKINCCG